MTSRPGRAAELDLLLDLFDAQARSRWLDVAARRLQAAGLTQYRPACAGHEVNAALALSLRRDDPALLHPRSAAFYLARSAQAYTDAAGSPARRLDGAMDLALNLVGSAHDPMAGGRHAVLGHPDLAIVPHLFTGTVDGIGADPTVGHLPRALGLAWTIGRQRSLPARLRRRLRWPDTAVAVASFGDAAANHSTVTGVVNAACWAQRHGIALPLLLVCEDNGIGLSTRSPDGWVAGLFADRAGLEYRYDDGTDPLASLALAREAVELARDHKTPVLLHLRCTRVGGHGGWDDETTYRTDAQITADLLRDPLSTTFAALLGRGLVDAVALRRRWLDRREEVQAAVTEALGRPRLAGAAAVAAPLTPLDAPAVAQLAANAADDEERRRAFWERLPEHEGGLTLAESLRATLLDAGARWPELVVLGHDVARLGGMHGVTRGLQRRLGASRVVDTVADERSLLGLALGAGVSGLLPVVELSGPQALIGALDQLRGQAAMLPFLSRGGFRNPLVVRVPALANATDSALAALRDVPGLLVACPAHPSDAPGLLRTCLAVTSVDGRVAVVIEPAALYDERDMVAEGDDAWLSPYAPPGGWEMAHVPIGRAATWGTGGDLTIVTYGNGVRLALRAAAGLALEGIGARVVDLRWLAPLPVADVLRESQVSGRVLIVDEGPRTGGVGEGLVTALLESGFTGRIARLASDDCFVPAYPADALVLVQQEDVEDAARALLR